MSLVPYSTQCIEDDDIEGVVEVLRSPMLSQGPVIGEFEEALSAYTGAKYAVVVSSGTAALDLAVRALGLSTHATGITSPITFAASANCFLYNGITPTFSDVLPDTGLMDVSSVEAILRDNPPEEGVIIPVSLQGRVGDLPGIQGVAKAHGYYTIEDAAQSIGATYEYEGVRYKSGSCVHTDMAIMSFHPLKHVCTGEGGVVLTNDEGLAEKVRLLRSHGIVRLNKEGEPSWMYDQVDLGYHYRMSSIQAALGLTQLRKLPRFLEARRRYAKRYRELLSVAPFSDVFCLSPEDEGHGYHLFVIHFYNAEHRDMAHDFLKEKGYFTQVLYRPIYQFSYYEEHFGKQSLPGAEAYYGGNLAIPLFQSMTDAIQDAFIEALYEFCEQCVVVA